MEEYITLTELYIFNQKLFKKNLRSFLKNFKVSENDMVTIKPGKIGIKKTWVKKNIPSFNLKLEDYSPDSSNYYFQVKTILGKYNLKNFNPINLNMDSTMVKYFNFEGCRTPFFTKKGLNKIKVLYNDIPDDIYIWIEELLNGSLKSSLKNLNNVTEMVNLDHIPVFKVIGSDVVQSQLYELEDLNNMTIVDFKRLGDLKNEKDLSEAIERYKCPGYSFLQNQYIKHLKKVEENFNNSVKELKQEKVIEQLQQQLEKEKCLKDQVLSLTQSFIPNFKEDQQKPLPKSSPSVGLLKPSKIK